MKEIQTRFLKNLLILTSIVSALAASIYILLPQFVTPALPWLILFLAVTTYVLYKILLKASKEKFNRFTNYFMAATMSKLLLLLAVIAAYLYFFRDDAIRFTITLFILYLVYTVFEVIWLLRINKPIP